MKRTDRLLLALAAALTLSGCAASPVQYYTLSGASRAAGPASPAVSAAGSAAGSAARPSAGSAAGSANAGAVHIEVGPVGVPERLARPQMVIRNDGDDPDSNRRGGGRGDSEGGSTRVQVLEQQRWTSSFDSELRDAFAGAISTRSGAVDVTRGGRLPGQPVYRVAIRVRYLDAILDRQVDAGFGWTITRSDDSRSAICHAAVSQPIGAGMDELVHGIQQAVAAAAHRIAAQISQLQANGSATCDPVAETTAPSPAADVSRLLAVRIR